MENNKGESGLNNSEDITLNELFLNILSFFRYLRVKSSYILMFGFLGAMFGFAYSILKKPIYIAKCSFALEEGSGNTSGVGQYAGLASMVGIDVDGARNGLFQGDNLLELYKSRRMIKETLLTSVNYDGNKELLVDVYINFNNLRNRWKNNPQLSDLHFSENFKQPLNRVQDSIITDITDNIDKNFLSVSRIDKKLGIIEVQVKSTNEFFSKEFNDKLVSNVNDFYVLTKTKKSLENVHNLQYQTDSVRHILNGAISSSAAILDATPNLNLTRQILRAPVQRSQYDAEANKAILSELIKNLELTKLSLMKETPLIQVIDNPVYPLQKERIGKAFALVIGFILTECFVILFLGINLFVKSALRK